MSKYVNVTIKMPNQLERRLFGSMPRSMSSFILDASLFAFC
jgi:hypothetical protein